MSKKIRIAIVGAGNCASALVQGLARYKNIDETSKCVPGLTHPVLGGYLLRDIEIVAAFDVHMKKVGKDIAEAIWVHPNNAEKFCDVPLTGVTVSQGFLGDGVSKDMRKDIPVRKGAKQNVVAVLRKSGAEMLILAIPVGSREAARFYAQACIDAGIAFINSIPEFIASKPEWSDKFRDAGIPCAGDDVMSQVGATILHRALLSLIMGRGQTVLKTSQLNVGGNADFKNMMDRKRVESKKISKSASLEFEIGRRGIEAVPASYDPTLGDEKTAYIKIEGEQFGGTRFYISAELTVQDSPNWAGVMVNAIRLMKLSLDRGLSGYQAWSAYFFKSPQEQLPLSEGQKLVEEFIEESVVLSEAKLLGRSA